MHRSGGVGWVWAQFLTRVHSEHRNPPAPGGQSWNVYTQGMYKLSPSDHPSVWCWAGPGLPEVGCCSTSEPGTSQPWSCTWCLWKVCTSHRTCPAGSPSGLWRDRDVSFSAAGLGHISDWNLAVKINFRENNEPITFSKYIPLCLWYHLVAAVFLYN